MKTNPNDSSVMRRMDSVTEIINRLLEKLSPNSGFGPYFCLRFVHENHQKFISPIYGPSRYQIQQALADSICEDFDNMSEHLCEKFDEVFEEAFDDNLLMKMIEVDVYGIVDAAGNEIGYSWESFENDLRQLWPKFSEIASHRDFEKVLNYVFDLYLQGTEEEFYSLIYRVHGQAAHDNYWGSSKARSIVTVRSRLGRRLPQ